jgi:outer membrane biosynthesis protein TonB
VPTSSRQKTKAKPAAKKAAPPRRAPAPAKKPAPKKPAAKPAAKSTPKAPSAPAIKAEELEVPSPDGRRHVLSLSFVRDGDEFLARLETDAGHITELKNRSLDQLLTLVASELEDLLE